MRVIDIHERDARLFPRSELVDTGGRSLVLPETRRLSAVDLRDVEGGVKLRAAGFIGFLPLTSDIILNLRPKFALANLWRMLSLADEAFARILPVLRSYETADEFAPHHLLARAYCHYLRQILRSGIVRGYYNEAYRGHFRPKVEFGPTIARYLSRGNEVDVVSNVVSFSANLRVNRIIKAGCLRFLPLIPRTDKWSGEKALLEEALDALESVVPSPMEPHEIALSESVPMRVRDAYRGALTTYAVLLGFVKVGFAYRAAGSELPSFLFRLDDVFESFVRNILRAGLRGDGISIVNGNDARHQEPLFSDNRRFPVKPDIIFRKRKNICAVGEVKYKDKLEEQDRYQLISHTLALGAQIGIWVSPASSADEAGLDYVGSIGGARFHHYRLDLGSDLDVACDAMSARVCELIG